jgi:hypothetical protein
MENACHGPHGPPDSRGKLVPAGLCDGGTPTDPSDDEFLEFLGVVKESTGRSDDFCEAAVPLLT